MILIAAAVIGVVALLAITFTPRLTPETRRNAQLDLAALGALALFTAGFFWQILFAPNAWMPAGGGDLALFLYPTFRFTQEWLTRGVIPLWNPYIFGGMPLIGDIQSEIFYPPNLVTYFLSNPLAYRDLEYLSVLHFYIAGAGMFGFLRYGPLVSKQRPLDRLACLAGAGAFAFSDLFITHFGNLNLIASAAWLPLILLFFARALAAPGDAVRLSRAWLARSRSALANALIGGLFLALSFFAGHIQPFLFIVLILVLYAGYEIFVGLCSASRALLLLALTLAAGMGLSAITFLPALELAQLSVRAGLTYADAAQFSLPPIELAGILVPGFFGRGPQNAWGPWPRVEVGYLGVFPLILAGWALVLRRSRRTLFYALLTLAGLALALGGYAILHGWLFQFVPGFGQLRAPARFVFVMDFGLAALAAIGMDALLAPLSQPALALFRRAVRGGAWMAFVIALVAGALALGILVLGQGQDPALYQRIANAANALGFFILLVALSVALLGGLARGWLRGRAWGWLALALIFFDLFSLGAWVDIGTVDPTLAFQRADLIDFLRANTGLARIDSRTDVEGIWRPDTGLLYQLQDVNGDNPLVLSDFNTFWESTGGRDSPAYQLLNVKYVLTTRGAPMPSNFSKAFEGGGGITVWQNTRARPRAWFVGDTRKVADAAQARALLQDKTLDLARTALVSGAGARELRNPSGAEASVSITGYSPNTIRADVTAPAEGYLVLSEVNAPGWGARVDGVEVPVVQADALFRAVPVPAGQHQVELAYDPLSYRIGALISALTLGLVLLALIRLLFLK